MAEQNEEQVQEQRSKRDLGTIGGGPVPGSGPASSNIATTHPSRASDGLPTGTQPPIERSRRQTAEGDSGGSGNKIDPMAKNNQGGRHPSQPQSAMGDRDSRQNSAENITDPMTSRDPSKLDQFAKKGSPPRGGSEHKAEHKHDDKKDDKKAPSKKNE